MRNISSYSIFRLQIIIHLSVEWPNPIDHNFKNSDNILFRIDSVNSIRLIDEQLLKKSYCHLIS